MISMPENRQKCQRSKKKIRRSKEFTTNLHKICVSHSNCVGLDRSVHDKSETYIIYTCTDVIGLIFVLFKLIIAEMNTYINQVFYMPSKKKIILNCLYIPRFRYILI